MDLSKPTRWLAAAMAVALSAPPSPFAGADELKGALQIKGSDTMVNLCQAWAEAFMARHPQVTVAITGGGSGTGIAALISGTCDLVSSSRQMTDKEKTQIIARGRTWREWTVALDGLAVVVHPSNPVKQLTVSQLADLFTGRVRNWKEMGGANRAVVLLSREVNSGTHVYFKEHVLGAGQEFAPEALLMPSSQAIADEAAANPDAVGYYGMGYLNPKNRTVAVARTAADAYVVPSEANVRSGAYPIARPLFFYSLNEPQGLVKTFLDFAQSPEGQAIVQKMDFVPIQ